MQIPCFNCVTPSITPSSGPNPTAAHFKSLCDIEGYLLWDYPGWSEMQNRRKYSWRAMSLARSLQPEVWRPDQIGWSMQTNRQTSRRTVRLAQSNQAMTQALEYLKQFNGSHMTSLTRFLCPCNKIRFEALTGLDLIDCLEKAVDNRLVLMYGDKVKVNPLVKA